MALERVETTRIQNGKLRLQLDEIHALQQTLALVHELGDLQEWPLLAITAMQAEIPLRSLLDLLDGARKQS